MGYLLFFRYVLGFLEIFDGCPADISWVSCRYLMGFPEIFDVFPSYS